MACLDDSERKCFTFIWKLENASYCWQCRTDCIESPSFTVYEIHDTIWKLQIYFPIENDDVELYLQREVDDKNQEAVKIDCNLAFLSSVGEVLCEFEKKNEEISETGWMPFINAPSQKKVFWEKKSDFIPQDTLTVRCRMWKSVGEMSKDVHCFERTRIAVERRSFLWTVKNFNTLKRTEKEYYEIKSQDLSKTFMSLELFLTGGRFSEEKVILKVIPNYQNIRMCEIKLSIIAASKNPIKCFQEEFWYLDPCDSKYFTLFGSKSQLLENKSSYLPNDILSLSCECTFSVGTFQGEIEKIDSECLALLKMNLYHRNLDNGSEFAVSKCVLMDNLKSILNDSTLSDVKLKTKSQTYPAHTSILGARSPVFKAMFSNDMKEKIKECVDFEDLNDDTVLRMLRYIYSAEVELEWTSATELYEAADKYQILTLKDICSSYLKDNLCAKNVCEALMLADLHQDEDLKCFVQDFILSHGEDIINTEEWDQLAETNVKLAYETTRRKFKK